MAHCAVQWPNIRVVGFEANEWLHDEDRLVAFIDVYKRQNLP